MFNIIIHSSGSQNGNCVQIDNVIVDLGVRKKFLTDHEIKPKDIEAVLLSHRHTDHFVKSAFKYFNEKDVLIYLSNDIKNHFNIEDKETIRTYEEINLSPSKFYKGYNYGEIVLQNGTKIHAIPQKHDEIGNYAFVFEKGNERLLYSTDLDTLQPSDLGDGLLHLGKFDVILLEGNFDETYLRSFIGNILKQYHTNLNPNSLTDEELNAFIRQNYSTVPKKIRQTLFRAVQNLRHLSKTQARAYVKNHLKPNGIYYEIHRSSQFYEQGGK